MRPPVPRSAIAAALVVGALLAGAAGAAAPAPTELPTLAPRLLYYPLVCKDARGCRLDCYQRGVNVISRFNLEPHDDIRLVLSSGIAEDLQPRWIEIRPASGQPETILLTHDTLCDLQSLVIRPIAP